MIDIAQLISTTTISLNELSKQTTALGTGLQNAAPGNKNGNPSNSVQYLLDISDALADIAKKCEELTLLSMQYRDTQKNHD
ncbi:MAG: hypothetical protein A3F11_04800 [Gammaproteobacteria bacterium RIFCSPHIGHO2_12_FULL_37_14]|nr:MAG: hypothetical protein A3F11_04800 [Gammaproteobacteria bacterium RIFCSPHIGHO2_12_FULL_37_14]